MVGADSPGFARDKLLQKIASAPNLTALARSVSQFVALAPSSDEAVRSMAHVVLSDGALKEKILRLANTLAYRTASDTQVTTISRELLMARAQDVTTNKGAGSRRYRRHAAFRA